MLYGCRRFVAICREWLDWGIVLGVSGWSERKAFFFFHLGKQIWELVADAASRAIRDYRSYEGNGYEGIDASYRENIGSLFRRKKTVPRLWSDWNNSF